MLETTKYGRGFAGYDGVWGKQTQRGPFYQEPCSKLLRLYGSRRWRGCSWPTWKVVLDVLCSLPGTRRRNWLSAKILCRLYCSKWSYRQSTLVFPQCLKNTSKALIWSFRYLRSYSCFHFCFCIFNVCSNNMMDFGVDELKPERRAGLNRLCSQGGCSELILETHFEFVTFIFGKRTKWYTSFKPSDKPLRPLWLNHSAICCWTTHFQIKGCKTEFGSPVKCSTCTGA